MIGKSYIFQLIHNKLKSIDPANSTHLLLRAKALSPNDSSSLLMQLGLSLVSSICIPTYHVF